MTAPALRLIACILVLAAVPARAATMSLTQALAAAYNGNPQIQSARAALKALDQGVAQADAGWRPTISASGSYGVDHGVVQGIAAPFNSNPLLGQVTISESIYRGGRTVAEIGRANALVDAGRAQLTQTEQAVLLAATTAYMDVVRDFAVLRFSQDNVHTLEDQLKGVRTELSVGAVTLTDTRQTEARLARAHTDLAQAQQRLAASRAAFEHVVGQPAGTLEESVGIPRLPQTQDAALSVALRENPAVTQAKANTRAADYAVDDAVGALLPEVSVVGQYQYLRDAAGTNIFTTKSPQSVVNVLGQVTIPIYQGGAEEATVRRARDVKARTQFDADDTQRGVQQDVATAWQAFLSQRAALTAAEAEADADRAAFSGVQQERQGGQRSQLDVLNAEQELISAEIAAASARHDHVVAAYRLLSATGLLTARSLALPVRLYDPQLHYDEKAHAWIGFGD